MLCFEIEDSVTFRNMYIHLISGRQEQFFSTRFGIELRFASKELRILEIGRDLQMAQKGRRLAPEWRRPFVFSQIDREH